MLQKVSALVAGLDVNRKFHLRAVTTHLLVHFNHLNVSRCEVVVVDRGNVLLCI